MPTKPVVGENSPTIEQPAPFRLRHIAALLAIVGIVAGVWPRARATLELHDRAVALADYALCMVGPVGPDLVRKNPDGFLQLVRQRILVAMPQDIPLQRCAALAEKLRVEYPTMRLHHVRAADIAEYHNDPRALGRFSLSHYQLPLVELDTLAQSAWPFVRTGYEQLMQPSTHAFEAAQPAAPPAFGLGSGLPSARALYRSTAAYGDTWVAALGSGANSDVFFSKNGGLDWRSGGQRLASDLIDRCVVDDEGRGFTLSKLNGGERIVVSQGPGAPPQVAILGPGSSRVVGVSCDDSVLLAALVGQATDGLREVSLRLCPFRRPCRDMSLPDLGGAPLFYPADVTRIGGDTVLSRTVRGVTRVATSRDDGGSWTPWVVVYDAATSSLVHSAPHQLLSVGDTVLLYGSHRKSEAYPVLVSTDHGASFHAPLPSVQSPGQHSASL